MVRLFALWVAALAVALLLVLIREERLASRGKVPVGRLRRLWVRSDRRRAPRYRIDWPIRYERMNGGELDLAASRDVSETGIGLMVRERLEVGSSLRLTLALPGDPQPVTLTGRVMWSRPIPEAIQPKGGSRYFFVGIHFQETDPQRTAKIQAALEKIRDS